MGSPPLDSQAWPKAALGQGGLSSAPDFLSPPRTEREPHHCPRAESLLKSLPLPAGGRQEQKSSGPPHQQALCYVVQRDTGPSQPPKEQLHGKDSVPSELPLAPQPHPTCSLKRQAGGRAGQPSKGSASLLGSVLPSRPSQWEPPRSRPGALPPPLLRLWPTHPRAPCSCHGALFAFTCLLTFREKAEAEKV